MVLVCILIVTMTTFPLFSLTVFLTALLSVSSSRSRIQSSSYSNLDPPFRCENGERTVLTKHNDGVDDCGDNSDEYNDPLLLYTVLHPEYSMDPAMRGFFLKSGDNTFRTQLMTSCRQPWTLFGAHARYVYLMCPGYHDNLIQIMRNGSFVRNITRSGKEIQALVFDEITSNAYLLENRRIKLCDSDLVFCALLQGKLRHKPISLTFSAGKGLLFWIEEKTVTETLIVSARRDGTDAKIILRESADQFEFVTVDESTHRLYWITNVTKNICSSLFDGSDQKTHGFALNNVQTFVVDNGRLFWGDQIKSEAQTCDIETNARSRCNPVRYAPEYSQVQIGRNIIIYKGAPKTAKEEIKMATTALSPREEEIEEHICDRSTCSHLCTYHSETEHTCFCDTSETGVVRNTNKGFCEGVTLLVTLGNHLYVIGFNDKLNYEHYAPIIRKTTLKNMDAVSAVAYDSIRGRVILAETGKQNIYVWTLGRKEPELIVKEGQGTITSLEFDEVGDNIYWISPSDSTLKATSCVTNKTIDIDGWRTTLLDFTLDPNNGYVFLLTKTNVSINLERISMTGYTNTTVHSLLHFDHTNTTDLSLYYMRSKDILILTDRLNGEIKYAEMKKYSPNDENIRFEFLIDNDLGGLGSVTSLQESIVWTEMDGLLRSVDVPVLEHKPVQRIKLNLPNAVSGSMNIASVVSAHESTRGGCRIGRECQDLCLVSNATSLICSSYHTASSNESEKEHETPVFSQQNLGVDFTADGKNDSRQPEVEPERLTHRSSASILEYSTPFVALTLLAAIFFILVYKLVKNKREFRQTLHIGPPTISTTSLVDMVSISEGT